MHPDLVILVGNTSLLILLYLKSLRAGSMHSGTQYLLMGFGLVSIIAVVNFFITTGGLPVEWLGGDLERVTAVVLVFGYFPSIVLMGIGFVRWFDIANKLSAEARKRSKAEESLHDRTQQLKEALAVAEEANKTKTEFLANMSHELRTPLNAILGFSELMTRRTFGELGHDKYDEHAALIHSSGSYLLDIINDLLDMSKIEVGQMELEEEAFFLRSIIRECIPIIQSQADHMKNKVTIVTDEDDEVVLWADRRLVKQMLLNLLSNSLKNTPSVGTITVRSYASGEGHVLEVEDTGKGMSKEEVQALLEPFNSFGNTMVRPKGTGGLGLAIVKTFMGLHEGKIDIQSKQPGGTKARLIFPEQRAVKAGNTDVDYSVPML